MEEKTFVIKFQEGCQVFEVIWHGENEDSAFESFRNSFDGKDFEKVLWAKVFSIPQLADIFWMSTVE